MQAKAAQEFRDIAAALDNLAASAARTSQLVQDSKLALPVLEALSPDGARHTLAFIAGLDVLIDGCVTGAGAMRSAATSLDGSGEAAQ